MKYLLIFLTVFGVCFSNGSAEIPKRRDILYDIGSWLLPGTVFSEKKFVPGGFKILCLDFCELLLYSSSLGTPVL